MAPMKATVDPKLVYFDPFLLDRARIALGKSQKDVVLGAKRLNTLENVPILDFRTFKRALSGEGVQSDSALLIAHALGRELLDLLAPHDPRYLPPKELSGPLAGESEWEMTGYLEQGRLAPNGLYYIVCRMRHRHVANRVGRGKYYFLATVPHVRRESIRHQLTRHSDVCTRVGSHPHLALNHTSVPASDGWWVIDEWVGERTLADHLKAGTWPAEKLPQLLYEIAVALDALHRQQVVLRESAPARVLISDRNGRAVLTDFELAKLLDGSPSVSGDWPDDEYRAPEVCENDFTVQADLYSLGRIAVRCAAPEFPTFDRLPVALGAAGVPKRVSKLLIDCVEPLPERRPPNLASLLQELERWAHKSSNGKPHGS